MMSTQFEVNESVDGQFYWVLRAGNGETVATSEMYTRKHDAVRSAYDMKVWAQVATFAWETTDLIES